MEDANDINIYRRKIEKRRRGRIEGEREKNSKFEFIRVYGGKGMM